MTKPAERELLMTTKAVALVFGVTNRTILNWHKNGMPKVSHGVFNMREVHQWWMDNIADMRTETASMKDVQLDYWSARSKAEWIKVDQLRGNLISIDDIHRQWAKRLLILFAGLEGMKNRLPPVLVGKTIKQMQKLIGLEISEFQKALQKPGRYYPDGKIKKGKARCKKKLKKSTKELKK